MKKSDTSDCAFVHYTYKNVTALPCDMWAVKLCSNKILQFLTGGAS